MPPNERKSEFYADDKDIQDLLASARQKMTTGRLVELSRKRGILLSEEEDREVLVDYISLLPHAWPEMKDLLDAVETAVRTPASTVEQYSVQADSGEIERAIESVLKDRDTMGEAINFVRSSDGSVRMSIEYTEWDPSKARLRQRRVRTAVVEFSPSEAELVLRRHQTDRAEEVAREVMETLAKNKQTELAVRRVELTGVTDPAKRTAFFYSLIRGLPGFGQLVDVDHVDVSRFPPNQTPGEEGGENELDETDTHAMSRRVLLKGDSLLGTPEFRRLSEDGFFIGEARWRVAKDAGEPLEVVVEAGFSDPVEGTGFGFKVCGVYRAKKSGEIAASRDRPSPAERRQLTLALEDAARNALPGAMDE